MIDFYYYGTINGKAVAIALEELKIDYQLHLVDLAKGEQRHAQFLQINPSGRVPVIVDHAVDGQLTVSQTAAILIYLAEKTGQLLPSEVASRAATLQWLQFIVTDIGVNIFNNFHLKALVQPKQPVAADMLKKRSLHYCEEIEQQLQHAEFINGYAYSIADVMAVPVFDLLKAHFIIANFSEANASKADFPNLSRWYEKMMSRAAVQKGLNR